MAVAVAVAAARMRRAGADERSRVFALVFESYRVSLSACQKHPGSEAMTGDIRYVSPITQTVCKEYSVLRQGK